jgi:hypothetical protein
VRATDRSGPGALVDVVAEVDDQIQVLGRHVLVRGEVALGVVLATREREAQRAEPGPGARRGTGAPYRADLVGDPEPVPVHAVRPQAVHLGVYRMRPRRRGTFDAAADDPAEVFVLGHLPPHVGRAAGHAPEPVDGERVGRQAGPEHDTVRRRIPGRHAQCEHVAGQHDPVVRRRGRLGGENRRTHGDSAQGEEVAAGDLRHGVALSGRGIAGK